MAKSKRSRKPSTYQLDPEIHALAKVLKQRGFLSKRTNLRKKALSRHTVKKVLAFQADIYAGHTTIKVPKTTLEKAKKEGFEVINGRLVVPQDRGFINRVKKGLTGGVKPVKGGFIEAVILPYDIYDMRSLVHRLKVEGLDNLKVPGEQFAFKFHGHMSYQPFMNSKHLVEYLTHYRSMFDAAGDLRAENLTEQFENFQLFRLNPVDTHQFIPPYNERNMIRKRKSRPRKERLHVSETMHPQRFARMQKRQLEYSRAYREEIRKNPAEFEAYKKAALERAKASKKRREKK